MAQLGKAVSILVNAVLYENELHADVAIMGAPSECHGVVARGEGRRMRLARRRALKVAGVRSMRELRRRVRGVLGNDAPIHRRYGFVPY